MPPRGHMCTKSDKCSLHVHFARSCNNPSCTLKLNHISQSLETNSNSLKHVYAKFWAYVRSSNRLWLLILKCINKYICISPTDNYRSNQKLVKRFTHAWKIEVRERFIFRSTWIKTLQLMLVNVCCKYFLNIKCPNLANRNTSNLCLRFLYWSILK